MVARIIKSITELPVDEIVVGDRLRPVSEAGVQALVASIGELGILKDPIHVRRQRHKGTVFKLMAGGHRLAAFKHLERPSIPLVCWECDDDFARLMEVDDNLAGADLSVLDTAVFLAERKAIYEKMHPEAKQGGNRGNQHTGGRQTDIMSFCQATAEKFGKTDRHIRRLLAAGAALSPYDRMVLRDAPQPVTLDDLTVLSKVDAKERSAVCERLRDGSAKKASAALKAIRTDNNGKTEPSRQDDLARRLDDAWNRAPKAARRAFADANRTELLELLGVEVDQ